MTAQLIDADMKEMTMELPGLSFSRTGGVETERFVIENRYADALFQTVRTPFYSVIDARMRSRECLKVYSQTEANDYIWFCAALQGRMTSACGSHGEETWQSGQSNLMTYTDVEGYSYFGREKPFRMLEIMLSTGYLEQIAAACPGLFDEILAQHARRQFVRATAEHIRFCPRIGKALQELLNYESAGNAASMYLDAKIREILSLFLYHTARPCDCCTPRDSDLLHHAKAIIERDYLNPPSLHRLALMVGTNECKLKHGFKSLFGTTVFGHLFDYRMEMACRHLLDSDKTIQEIAALTGYEHHSHFTVAFRRKFCVSPQAYRFEWKKAV
ncbi:MAG: AraC family transcriptional regulator [Tannerella sp.]|jgi:AraC-like DNA-binding protein|nr:AraC family transcriptional regulator [Tannerella sp.]